MPESTGVHRDMCVEMTSPQRLPSRKSDSFNVLTSRTHGDRREDLVEQHRVHRHKESIYRELGWKGRRGTPWNSVFARKARRAQRAIIRAPWTSPVAAHHLAATEVSRLKLLVGVSLMFTLHPFQFLFSYPLIPQASYDFLHTLLKRRDKQVATRIRSCHPSQHTCSRQQLILGDTL